MRLPRAADLGRANLQGAGGAAQLNLSVAKETGAAAQALGSAIAQAGGIVGKIAGLIDGASSQAKDAFALPEAQLAFDQQMFEAESGLYNNAGEDGSGLKAYPQVATSVAATVEKDYGARFSPEDKAKFGIYAGRQTLEGTKRAYNEWQSKATAYATGKENSLVEGRFLHLDQSGGWSDDAAYNSSLKAATETVQRSVGQTRTESQAAKRINEITGQFASQRIEWLSKNDPEAAKVLLEKIESGVVDENAAGVPGAQGTQSGAAPAPGPQSGLNFETPSLKRTAGRARSGPIKGFVIHETQGSDTIDGNTSWSNKKNTGANYYIDKQGQIFQWAPDNVAMNHAGVGRGGKGDVRPDLGNGNTLSVEILTRPGEKPNEAQHAAAQKLIMAKASEYGFKPEDVEAHGRLAPGHKEVTEGVSVLEFVRQNWDGAPASATASAKPQAAPQSAAGGQSVNLTAYSPQRGGSSMEGGYAAARPGPDGQAVVRTLADVASGKAEYVTVAGNPSEYGKTFVIPQISYVDSSGKTQTLTNVKAVVHDTGSAFKDAPAGRYDIPIDRDASNAQMAKSHALWKKEGVEFVADGGAAPADKPVPVSERGLTRVAGLEQRGDGETMTDAGGGVLPADEAPQSEGGGGDPGPIAGVRLDMSGGQATAKLPTQLVEQLYGIAAENPDAIVSQYLTDDLNAQLAETGVIDPEKTTVGQVMQLAEAAKAEGALSLDRKQVPGPIEGGRLLKGQTFSVKAGGKSFSITAEQWNAISPKQRQALRKSMQERLNVVQKERVYAADHMMKTQLATVERTGKGAEKFDPKLIAKVYRDQPQKIQKFNDQIKVAQFAYDAQKDVWDLPEEQLETRKAEIETRLIDGDGDVDPDIAKVYERTQKKLDQVAKLRATDPAKSVENTKEVRSFVQKFMPEGQPNSNAQLYGLVDARIQAQVRLGMEPTPLTKREAVKMLEPLVRAGSFQQKKQLARELVTNLRTVYQEHAEVVLNSALFLNSRETEDDRLTLSAQMRAAQREQTRPEPPKTGRGMPNRQDRLGPSRPNPYDQFYQ